MGSFRGPAWGLGVLLGPKHKGDHFREVVPLAFVWRRPKARRNESPRPRGREGWRGRQVPAH
eukprot:3318684-Pyramimonas_sp.AAC.2